MTFSDFDRHRALSRTNKYKRPHYRRHINWWGVVLLTTFAATAVGIVWGLL